MLPKFVTVILLNITELKFVIVKQGNGNTKQVYFCQGKTSQQYWKQFFTVKKLNDTELKFVTKTTQ